jgi:hypothetical protein
LITPGCVRRKKRKNDEGRSDEERARPARDVWRPAKHIFARDSSRMAPFRASICPRPVVENRGGVRRDKTVSLPNHPHAAHGQSQSKWIKPMLPVKLPGKSMQTIYHE